MFSLFRHELRIRRTAILGWGLGIGLFTAYVIILFPQFQPTLENFNLGEIPAYQIFGDFSQIASFAGFVSAEVFTFAPILLAIYAVVNGTGTLAGEEDNGTLELLVAQPLRRWQLAITKFLALTVALVLILAIMAAISVASMATLEGKADTQGISLTDLGVAVMAILPITLLFATMSLFLGAYLPSRRIAATIAALVVVFSYFANNLASLSEPLEKLQFLYPFHYFDSQSLLTEGINSGDTLVLLGASAVFLALTLLSFQRRNITVGAWPWQRARVPS